MTKLFTSRITRPHLYNVDLSDLNAESPLGSIADVVNGRIISFTKQERFHRDPKVNDRIRYQWDASSICTSDAIFLRREGDAIIERQSRFLFEKPITVDSDFCEVILSAEQWEKKKNSPHVLYLIAEEMKEVYGKGFYPSRKKIFAYHDPAKKVEELLSKGYVTSQVALQNLSLWDQCHLREKGYIADFVTLFSRLPSVDMVKIPLEGGFSLIESSSWEDFDAQRHPERYNHIGYVQNGNSFIFNGDISPWFYADNPVVEKVWNFLLDGAKEQSSYCDDERSVYGRFFQVFALKNFELSRSSFSSQALGVNFPNQRDLSLLLPRDVGVMRYLTINPLFSGSNIEVTDPLAEFTRMNMLYMLKESATYPSSSRVNPPLWRGHRFD